MSKKIRGLAYPIAFALVVGVTFLGALGGGKVQSGQLGNAVLNRARDIELGVVGRKQGEQLVSSGAVYGVLAATGELERRADKEKETGNATGNRTVGCSNVFVGGGGVGNDNSVNQGGGGVNNIRVNQDCSLRRQAEAVVVANPTNPDNLIAGQNDSRIGFNHCGYDFSFDGGKTWGDQIPPFFQFILKDEHTADACSDPTATFDSKGNAYIGGILFQVGASAANALVVAKSNAPIGGAFYHTPKSSLTFQTYRDIPLGVVASDNDPNIFHDKELIVADANAASPKADNVYATWTRFNAATGVGVDSNSPIFFSQSTNGGAAWSVGVEISGASADCTDFSGSANANACDQDQGSHPIVGPDGAIYVAFGNGNTPLPGINQHLVVKCPAAADCSKKASWTAPVKISDDFGTQPSGPNATTGCPGGGRQCLPPNGYRLDDTVEGSISIDASGKLYFAWADFRNGGGTCPPLSSASTATPPCNNDVFYTFSTDHGATWHAQILVTPASEFGQTAQWMPWSAVAQDGKKLYIAYYDRSYGSCETTGCNDITLATVEHAATASPSMKYTRITTSSMPNLVPANNPLQAGFLGDYMWVSVDAKGNPLIVWSDTRGLNGTVEEDIYFARP